jgi:hypothetical protein
MVKVKILRTLFALLIAFSSLGLAHPAAGAALDSWTATGPGVGSIFAIAVNPLAPNVLYAGTVGGGIYKSSNYGQTWSAANHGITDTIVYSMAVDPGIPGLVYAGTRDPNTAESGRVFKSTDAGATWTVSGLSDTNYVNALAADPKTPGTVYAGTFGKGVFKSSDWGDHWAATGLTDAYVFVLAADPTTAGTLYAGTLSGVSKSTDWGATWNTVFSDATYIAVHAIGIDPQDSNNVYIGTLNPDVSGGAGGIFKSPDGGKNWNPVLASNPGPYIRSLVIDASHPATVYAGSGDPLSTTGNAYIYKTINGGTDWSELWSDSNNTTVLNMAIDPANPANVYAGIRRRGVIKSYNNGQNWSESNAGLNNTYIHSLAIAPTDPPTMYAGTWNGIYLTTNQGQNWDLVFVGPVDTAIHSLAIDPSNADTIYAGVGDPISSTLLGGVQKTIDGGGTWLPSGLVGSVVEGLVINPTTPSVIFAATDNGVYRSKTSGAGWSPILCCNWTAALAIDPSEPDTLYAGTLGAGVFKSQDGGDHWAPASVGIGDTSFVNALVIDPTDPATLYAATGYRLEPTNPGGVFKSTNHGSSWAPAGLSSTRVYSLAIAAGPPVTLFAGTSDSGVFVSQNGGANWLAMNDGLPAFGSLIPINALAVDPASGATVFAGTDGSGSYRAQTPNPVPTLTALSSYTQPVGGGGFTLTVTGTNFVNGSVVKWGTANLATVYTSPTQLNAMVTPSNLGAAGLVPITVENPGPGGGVSNSMPLTVEASLPITPAAGGQMQFPDLQGQIMTFSATAGAVTQAVTLVWIPQDGLPHGAGSLPGSYAYGGKAFILKVLVNGVPQDNFTFQTPVTLSLQYRPGDLGGILESFLRLFYWDGTANAWKDAACGQGYSRNPLQHTLTVQVCHASEFGLLGPTNEHKAFLSLIRR